VIHEYSSYKTDAIQKQLMDIALLIKEMSGKIYISVTVEQFYAQEAVTLTISVKFLTVLTDKLL
jgi:hypothetical protein